MRKSPGTIPIFNTLDRSAGDFITQQSKDTTGSLALAGALVSYALRQGHVCLDLARLNEFEHPDILNPADTDTFQETIRTHPWIGSEKDDKSPLILAKSGKLYFHRYWHYEQRLINTLRIRMAEDNNQTASSQAVNEFLNSFPALGAQQQEAVKKANTFNTTLISGGPGTGKTTTVLFILASLVSASRTNLKIGLSAPTGKAAQRINDSLKAGLEDLPLPDKVKNLIPTEAVTLHRLLGYKHNSVRFKHNQDLPLPYDVVVVDEASMLDLLMFSKLFDALSPTTRLVMLGDRHQLASVEAGSIFGDLIEASYRNAELARLTVELNTSYRFGSESSIHQTCQSINTGDSTQVLRRIQQENSSISLAPLPSAKQWPHILENHMAKHLLALSRAASPTEALDQLTNCCLLTPHRKGALGVEGLNQAMDELHRRLVPEWGRTRNFPGQPIVITENSYNSGLFNGDLGIVFSRKSEPNEYLAYFPGVEDTGLRRFPLSSLPPHEPAYAFTVHKSQGSEYKKVFLVIPSGDSPVLTRELLYTAISRSRGKVKIWASEDSIKQAVNNPIYRTSGILNSLT